MIIYLTGHRLPPSRGADEYWADIPEYTRDLRGGHLDACTTEFWGYGPPDKYKDDKSAMQWYEA